MSVWRTSYTHLIYEACVMYVVCVCNANSYWGVHGPGAVKHDLNEHRIVSHRATDGTIHLNLSDDSTP